MVPSPSSSVTKSSSRSCRSTTGAADARAKAQAVKAGIEGDASTLVSKYAEGAGLLERANGHALWYINHYE